MQLQHVLAQGAVHPDVRHHGDRLVVQPRHDEVLLAHAARDCGRFLVHASGPRSPGPCGARRASSSRGPGTCAPTGTTPSTGLWPRRARPACGPPAPGVPQLRLGRAEKAYLSHVVDLFDGRPVAWSVGPRPTAALANSSLEAACATLAPGERPVIHTDRGGRYRWPGWVAACERHGLVRSMSRKGRSPDNARMEGFLGRLKVELFHLRDWDGWTTERFAGVLGRYVEWYNSGRLKSFRADGYDTIDGRRDRLGLAAKARSIKSSASSDLLQGSRNERKRREASRCLLEEEGVGSRSEATSGQPPGNPCVPRVTRHNGERVSRLTSIHGGQFDLSARTTIIWRTN